MLYDCHQENVDAMKRPAQLRGDHKFEATRGRRTEHRSVFEFFVRYPIFLLFFGPPIFRPTAGIDATKGNIDIRSFLQVGLLSWISLRAIIRLANAQLIVIPRQIRSILWLSVFLGLLFTIFCSILPQPSSVCRVLGLLFSHFDILW